LVTLDDVTRSFTADDLLITDGHDRPVGIAGIMGGADCEIGPDTTDVLLEMAWFDPTSISRTSRRLGLRSEASARFEKGADPGVVALAADRFCELAAEICGASTEPVQVDVRGTLPSRPAGPGAHRARERPARHRPEPVADRRAAGPDRVRRRARWTTTSTWPSPRGATTRPPRST
jgi:phenylalanyl-tRNA synthetase beta chain